MTIRELPMIAFVLTAGVRLAMSAPLPEFDGHDEAELDALHYEADLPEVPALIEIRVRHGESLYDLARWASVTIEDLETLNEIDLHAGLRPGQTLEVALTDAEFERFAHRRGGAAKRRAERYLARRGGLVEMRSHRVRTGETLWGIARANGRLPMWFLATYNEGRDLDRIAIGDTLQIPVVGDSLAAR